MGKATTNFGDENKIEVRPDNDADRRGLLQFNLSDIPPDATITSATLYLYEQSTKASQITYIYRVTTAWNESGVTWNSPWQNPGGDFEIAPAYALFIPDQQGCSISLDITNLVQTWVNGTYPNYGLILYSTGQNHIVDYASKEEAKNPERAPRLDIQYTQETVSQQPGQAVLRLIDWIVSLLGDPKIFG